MSFPLSLASPLCRYTGRIRRRWFFWTQYEYESPVWTGAKWQNPWNEDRWPRGLFWTYEAPRP